LTSSSRSARRRVSKRSCRERLPEWESSLTPRPGARVRGAAGAAAAPPPRGPGAAFDDGAPQVRLEPRERARRGLDLAAVDDQARRALEHQEHLLLVARGLVVLRYALSRRNLDE